MFKGIRQKLKDEAERVRNRLHSSPDSLEHPRWRPPPAWPLQDEDLPRPTALPQSQSPLFNKLAAELRINIYQTVLGDHYNFMHILPAREMLGHFRCQVVRSEFPTWQHWCFGEWKNPGGHGNIIRRLPGTDDKLLSLLLTCRLIYSEAISILYSDNIFHFKGAKTLLAFHASLCPVQWQAIRTIHISTVFWTETKEWVYDDLFPPERIDRWGTVCQALLGLHEPHSVKLDIVVRNPRVPYDTFDVDVESILSILEPLKNLKARCFEIEMNFELPASVRPILGATNFHLVSRQRPYDMIVFGA